ncbi:mCG8333 [Mus musculus]|nr:mCG8333 [Mus musculus]
MNSDLKTQLREFNVTMAKENGVVNCGGQKAIIIFVPFPQLKSFQKIQVWLSSSIRGGFCPSQAGKAL